MERKQKALFAVICQRFRRFLPSPGIGRSRQGRSIFLFQLVIGVQFAATAVLFSERLHGAPVLVRLHDTAREGSRINKTHQEDLPMADLDIATFEKIARFIRYFILTTTTNARVRASRLPRYQRLNS
jgi:hypothetical protein